MPNYYLDKPPISAPTDNFVFSEWFARIVRFVKAISNPYIVSNNIAYTVINFDYTPATTDFLIQVDCSGGNRTITLPPAIGFGGKPYVIKKKDATNNYILVNTLGGLIDDQTSQMIIGQEDTMYVISDNTNWQII